ncbi:MAG: ribonuclease D [Anaerolineae bacterium]
MLSPATYIDTTHALLALVAQLKDEPLLAVDTESNSTYVYQEQVCLIQLSTRTADYIVDPLMIEDMAPLGALFASPTIEKVFHGAEYDVVCLKRDFGYTFNNLFDTMVAARMCGFTSLGLGNMLDTFAGVTLDKSHQLDNWGQRPLPEESLLYAQMDTHFLPYLRDELKTRMTELDILEEAAELFYELTALPASEPRTFDPQGFWRIGRPNRLNRRELMILRELYTLREALAEENDLPPYKVLNNTTLVELARNAPKNLVELADVEGITPNIIRRYGSRLISAIHDGRRARKLPPAPADRTPERPVLLRYEALYQWRKARALARGVESDVIISKQTLWEIARKAPTTLDELGAINQIGPWRLAAYGQDILHVLEESNEE